MELWKMSNNMLTPYKFQQWEKLAVEVFKNGVSDF